MTIEKSTEKDFHEITEVWEAWVRATHNFLPESDILYFKPLIRNECLKAVNLFHFKDQNGNIAGFVGTSDNKIEMLFLHPSQIGMGLGKKLVRFAIDELKASKVDVNEQNPQAVGFYLHSGFKILNRSPLDGLGKPYPVLHLGLQGK